MASSFASCNAGVLKEPIGFIKPIQWVLSIFAFATTTSPVLKFSFTATCANSTGNASTTMSPTAYEYSVGYPFRLNDNTVPSICNNNINKILLEGGHAASGFYVFVGVIVFLYCMLALAFYILRGEQYRSNSTFSISDCVISGIIVILWLVGSSAWAQGLADLKYYTNLKDCGFLDSLTDCKTPNECKQVTFPDFASLNVSIIFGFLNMCVWIGNVWFVYKETPWKKNKDLPPTSDGGFSGSPSSAGEKGRI